MSVNNFIQTYLRETADIAQRIDQNSLKRMAGLLLQVKAKGGRVFFAGVGGGAGTGSHATNDFNKIAGIQALCLGDNASLLTALTNDEGWDSIFKRQLEMHKANSNDCLFIFSVNGGTPNISSNLVAAVAYAKQLGIKVLGVVGRDNGVVGQQADACVVVPCPDPDRRTPHTEDFQLFVNHILANMIGQDPQILLSELLLEDTKQNKQAP